MVILCSESAVYCAEFLYAGMKLKTVRNYKRKYKKLAQKTK